MTVSFLKFLEDKRQRDTKKREQGHRTTTTTVHSVGPHWKLLKGTWGHSLKDHSKSSGTPTEGSSRMGIGSQVHKVTMESVEGSLKWPRSHPPKDERWERTPWYDWGSTSPGVYVGEVVPDSEWIHIGECGNKENTKETQSGLDHITDEGHTYQTDEKS